MSATGSGIVLVGYADASAGVVVCLGCGADDAATMDKVYNTDTTEDTPPCIACGDALAEAGEGYGARGCAADGCGAILAYPDEGRACEAHTCQACGAVVDALAVFPQPYRDDAGVVWLDPNATACLACYAAIINTIAPDRMLRVEYYPRRKRRG